MRSKVFLVSLFCVLGLMLLCLCFVNYRFDKTGILNPDFSVFRCEPTESYIKAKFICDNPDKYDAFCFGSSRVGNIDVRKIPGDYRYYNMTYSEGVPQEWLEDIQLFLEHGVKIRQLILGLDDFSFRVNPVEHTHQELRLRYKGKFEFEKIASLYLKKPSFSGYKESEETGSLYDIYNTGNVIHEYPDKLVEDDVAKHISDEKFLFPKHYTGNRIKETMDVMHSIKQICDDNNIDLIVFINPIHRITYLDTDFEEFVSFKQQLATIVKYYDFAWINDVTSNNYYYYETSHYRPIVGDMIINNIFYKKPFDEKIVRYVTEDNVDEHIVFLRQNRTIYCTKNE